MSPKWMFWPKKEQYEHSPKAWTAMCFDSEGAMYIGTYRQWFTYTDGRVFKKEHGSNIMRPVSGYASYWSGAFTDSEDNIWMTAGSGGVFKNFGGQSAPYRQDWGFICEVPGMGMVANVRPGSLSPAAILTVPAWNTFTNGGILNMNGMVAVEGADPAWYIAVRNGTILYTTPPYALSSVFASTGSPNRNWHQLAVDASGGIYATAQGNGIYYKPVGTHVFSMIFDYPITWKGIGVSPINGDVYASVRDAGIWLRAGGTGDFIQYEYRV